MYVIVFEVPQCFLSVFPIPHIPMNSNETKGSHKNLYFTIYICVVYVYIYLGTCYNDKKNYLESLASTFKKLEEGF